MCDARTVTKGRIRATLYPKRGSRNSNFHRKGTSSTTDKKASRRKRQEAEFINGNEDIAESKSDAGKDPAAKAANIDVGAVGFHFGIRVADCDPEIDQHKSHARAGISPGADGGFIVARCANRLQRRVEPSDSATDEGMNDWHTELFVQAELDLGGLNFTQTTGRIIHIVFVVQNVGAKTERQDVQGHICHHAQFVTLVDRFGIVRTLEHAAIEVSVKVERVGGANGGHQESANKSNADGIHGILSVVMAMGA